MHLIYGNVCLPASLPEDPPDDKLINLIGLSITVDILSSVQYTVYVGGGEG